jgi:hypothetical protein
MCPDKPFSVRLNNAVPQELGSQTNPWQSVTTCLVSIPFFLGSSEICLDLEYLLGGVSVVGPLYRKVIREGQVVEGARVRRVGGRVVLSHALGRLLPSTNPDGRDCVVTHRSNKQGGGGRYGRSVEMGKVFKLSMSRHFVKLNER